MPSHRLATIGLLALALGLNVSRSQAQAIEEARAQLPLFTSTAEGQGAELYVYYPSVDMMVKVEATATAGLFSDLEFGYLVGDLTSAVSDLLAQSWYSEYDEATIASAASQLEDEAKAMRQPFERAQATVSVAMNAAGLTFRFSGQGAGGGETSFSVTLTWEEVLEMQ